MANALPTSDTAVPEGRAVGGGGADPVAAAPGPASGVALEQAARGELFPWIAAGDAGGAAAWLLRELSPAEELRAARTLAAHAVRGAAELAWVESLAQAEPGGSARALRLIQILGTAVDDALARSGHLLERRTLHEACGARLDPFLEDPVRGLEVTRALVGVWRRLADVRQAMRDADGLRGAAGRHLGLCRRLCDLAGNDPDNLAALAAAHVLLGDIELRQGGDPAGAEAAYRQALAALAIAPESLPAGGRAARLAARAIAGTGDVLRARGDFGGALAAYRRGLSLAQRGALAQPADANWQRELAHCHTRMGDVMADQRDHAGALLAHRQCLLLFERLHMQDTAHVTWQRELATSELKIGDALLAQGNVNGALGAYRHATARRARLATTIGAVEARHELWVALGKLADAHEKAGSDEAAHWWRQAHDVLAALKDAGHFRAGIDDQFLVWLRQKAFADGR